MPGRGLVEWQQHVARLDPGTVQRPARRFDQVLPFRFAICGDSRVGFGDLLSVLYLAPAHSANLVGRYTGDARGDRPNDGALFIRADHDRPEYCGFWSGVV